MKKFFAVALLCALPLSAQSNILSGPRVIGNGGDTIEETNLRTPMELMGAVPQTKLLIVAWLQGLETHLRAKKGLNEGSSRRHLTIPAGAEKLFSQGLPHQRDVYSVLRDLQISFRLASGCPSLNGHRGGSVLSENPPLICLSGFAISEKHSGEQARLQMAALIVHEVSHLMGTTEDEAVSLQKQYLQDMAFVSMEAVENSYRSRLKDLHDLRRSLIENLMRNIGNPALLCSKMDLSERLFTGPAEASEIAVIHPLSAREQDAASDLHEWLGLAVRWYVCAQALSPEEQAEWAVTYVMAFQGQDEIELKQFLKNLGFHTAHGFLTETTIQRIQTENMLMRELMRIDVAVENLRQSLEASLLGSRFEVIYVNY